MTHEPSPQEPSDFQEAVRAASKQVEESREAVPGKAEGAKPLLTRPPVVAGVALAFAGVLVWNVFAFMGEPPPPAPAQEETVLSANLFIAAQSIEAFRRENGRLPSDLKEVGLPTESFRYRITGSDYELTAVGVHGTLEFRADEGMETLLTRMGDAYKGGNP